MPRASAGPAHAIELRRYELERIEGAGPQYFKVSGEIEVDGTGEAAIVVMFPIYFVDKPLLAVGYELGPGQPFVGGNLPVSSVHVLRWERKILDDGSDIYVGAMFGIVTSGPDGQVVIVQYHAEGIGLRGPVPES